MKTPGFENGLKELIKIAGDKRTAYMCAELKWRSCHRSFISGALFKKGIAVTHIYNESEAEHHSELIGI